MGIKMRFYGLYVRVREGKHYFLCYSGLKCQVKDLFYKRISQIFTIICLSNEAFFI